MEAACESGEDLQKIWKTDLFRTTRNNDQNPVCKSCSILSGNLSIEIAKKMLLHFFAHCTRKMRKLQRTFEEVTDSNNIHSEDNRKTH